MLHVPNLEISEYLWIPITVVDDDCVSSSEGDALSTCPCRQQEHESILSCDHRSRLLRMTVHEQILQDIFRLSNSCD